MPQSPQAEIRERAAETIPGLAAAAKAVGLQDHQRMLRDSANRVRDAHRAQMAAAGFTPDQSGDDDMGDIFIAGDITTVYGDGASQPQPQAKPKPVATPQSTQQTGEQQAPTAQPQSSSLKKLIAAGLLSGLLGAGAGVGIPWAMGAFSKATVPAYTDTSRSVDVEKFVPAKQEAQ